MKLDIFRGDLTCVSAETKSLPLVAPHASELQRYSLQQTLTQQISLIISLYVYFRYHQVRSGEPSLKRMLCMQNDFCTPWGFIIAKYTSSIQFECLSRRPITPSVLTSCFSPSHGSLLPNLTSSAKPKLGLNPITLSPQFSFTTCISTSIWTCSCLKGLRMTCISMIWMGFLLCIGSCAYGNAANHSTTLSKRVSTGVNCM